ncbi:MAG TPA: glycosyltransferase family 2 protein [Ignavibacteria bacterium]|nr:glycosyltransferase family 2 protein [Ignavibacteria bacterium]HMR39496.1 glycosyltransferase family 2 protein [Ignavibacteria bacterium]
MISIIIPNFNGRDHLKDCFDSLKNQSYKDFEIFLVDNNSTDDSVRFTEKNYPEVKIIRFNYNSGFAIAVNQGIKVSSSEFVLLLNNDTECDTNFLREMLNGMNDKETGSVACKMLNYTNRDVIDDAGDFVKAKGSPYARGYGVQDIGQFDKDEFIFGACAGAALYRREIFDIMGYFDEDFFAYYEDVDFSFRMQLFGYKCFYNPKAVCFHKRGATTGGKSEFQTMLCEQNLVQLRLKNYPSGMYLKCLPYFTAVRVKRYYLFLTKHSFSLFFAAMKGYFRGLMKIPKAYSKRKFIQKNKVVPDEYLESILK